MVFKSIESQLLRTGIDFVFNAESFKGRLRSITNDINSRAIKFFINRQTVASIFQSVAEKCRILAYFNSNLIFGYR